MGRPSKLTADVALAIVESVSEGCTVDDAARAAGVNPGTVYRWQQQGSSTDPKDATYREFRDALTRARGTARRAVVGMLFRAATEDRDTKAAALWLDVTGRNLDQLDGAPSGRSERQLDEMTVQAVLALLDGPEGDSTSEGTDGARGPLTHRNGHGNGNGRPH